MARYDLIIPIGMTCKCTHNLRLFHRQFQSLPFDWILVPDLHTVHTALSTHFADFMKFENMEFKCKESEQTDIYFDRLTGFGFWHDFPHGVALEQSFRAVKEKYNRRIARLFELISQAQNILFVRVVTVHPDCDYSMKNIIFQKSVIDDNLLEEQFLSLRALYPDKNLSLAEISVFNEPHPFVKRVLSPYITRFEVYSPQKYEWQGQRKVFRKILSGYKLTYCVWLRFMLNSLKFKCLKSLVSLGAFFGISKYQEQKKLFKRHK